MTTDARCRRGVEFRGEEGVGAASTPTFADPECFIWEAFVCFTGLVFPHCWATRDSLFACSTLSLKPRQFHVN